LKIVRFQKRCPEVTPKLEKEEWNQIIRIAQVALSLFGSQKQK